MIGFALLVEGDVLLDYIHVTAVFRSSSVLFGWPREAKSARSHLYLGKRL